MKTLNITRMLKSARARLRHTRGAIDLASIMVGELVIGIIGIIGGVISATVFAVIAWSQDEAAKSALGSVRTAERASFVYSQPNVYRTLDGLVAEGWIQSSPNLAIGISASGDCYAAVARSARGERFWADSTGPQVHKYAAGSTSSCTDLAALAAASRQPTPEAAPPQVAEVQSSQAAVQSPQAAAVQLPLSSRTTAAVSRPWLALLGQIMPMGPALRLGSTTRAV